MYTRLLRYLPSFLLWVGTALAFSRAGWYTWIPVIYGFLVLPVLELILPPDPSNLSPEESKAAARNPWFTRFLYATVPLQYGWLVWFLFSLSEPGLAGWEVAGRTASMGLLCGIFGINVAHELGHRPRKADQLLSKLLLLTSQYPHFFIEHNRGHHHHVATPEDPSTARRGESLYAFWVRSVTGSYRSAWQLENSRLRRKGLKPRSLHNEMIRFALVQVLMLTVILLLFDLRTLGLYLAAATIGFLLLETVNYIEHYGLLRARVSENRYQNAEPAHSWNSDHLLGRMFLFELSRHSDHHYLPAKPYQLLDHHDHSPQMPTGYPGMMILAALPPLWFRVMDHRLPDST